VISKDFDIIKKPISGHKWNPPSFFGFDSETVIGDGFTRFANPVSVSLVKPAVSDETEIGTGFGLDKWITPLVTPI